MRTGWRRRTRGERAELVEAWRRSGLSGRAFAAREQIALSSLQRWARALRGHPARRPRPGVRPPGDLVPVHLVGLEAPAPIEIVLRGGRRVRCSAAADPDVLARVVAMLERLPC